MRVQLKGFLALFGSAILRACTADSGKIAFAEIGGVVWAEAVSTVSGVARTRSAIECTERCARRTACVTVFWRPSQRLCHFSESVAPTNVTRAAGSGIFYARLDNFGALLSMSQMDLKRSIVFKGCKDAASAGVTLPGIVYIDPDGNGAFAVRCDAVDTLGWVAVQRRLDGTEDFSRGWAEYKRGFGNLSGEFWLGLDRMRRLSALSGARLSVYLKTLEGTVAYANYSSFSVGPESSSYKLSVSGFSGNTSNALESHNSMTFSTIDFDSDGNSSNCADSPGGGWWYNSCGICNLNGPYARGPGNATNESIFWSAWNDALLTTVVMRIGVNA